MDAEVEKILAAYPPDRVRGKAACLAQIEEAMKEGIRPEEAKGGRLFNRPPSP